MFFENEIWRIKLMCVPKLNLVGLIVFITKIIEENGMATVRLTVVVWTQ